MLSNKPWYEMFPFSQFQLKEDDFLLSDVEMKEILSFYKNLIDFKKEKYNRPFIYNNFAFVDFLEFNYEDESIMDDYILEMLCSSREAYALPLVFSNEDLNCILLEFNPCAIAKINSNINDFNRIFGSMISDYSGSFLVTPVNFSYAIIVKNGHYALRFHRRQNIYKNRWRELSLGRIDMYEYDIKEISQFCDSTNIIFE